MKFGFGGEQHETQGIYRLDFGNELLDGVLVDFPNHFTFLSDSVAEHEDMIDYIDQEQPEGIDHYDLTETEIDYDQAPFSWIINSVSGLVVQSAVEACKEACDGTN